MKLNIRAACSCVVLMLASTATIFTQSDPFNGRTFRGRIAFSSDGNFNDEDDWGAFPVAAAILDAFGVMDKLVHVDYCNILVKNDPRFHAEMARSVLGSAERFGIPRSVLFDCQQNLPGAVESIKNAVNASSAENPLYYVLAGPMEVPFLGIEKSDPAKRKHVYCISHSGWNDGYHHADKSNVNTLRDDGRIKTFMEQTEFYKKRPHDDLAAGSAKWVLGNPGDSYIAYTYDYSGPMGIKNMKQGVYDLLWFDAICGKQANQAAVSVASGKGMWSKPESMGSEIALYIKRRAPDSSHSGPVKRN